MSYWDGKEVSLEWQKWLVESFKWACTSSLEFAQSECQDVDDEKCASGSEPLKAPVNVNNHINDLTFSLTSLMRVGESLVGSFLITVFHAFDVFGYKRTSFFFQSKWCLQLVHGNLAWKRGKADRQEGLPTKCLSCYRLVETEMRARGDRPDTLGSHYKLFFSRFWNIDPVYLENTSGLLFTMALLSQPNYYHLRGISPSTRWHAS